MKKIICLGFLGALFFTGCTHTHQHHHHHHHPAAHHGQHYVVVQPRHSVVRYSERVVIRGNKKKGVGKKK